MRVGRVVFFGDSDTEKTGSGGDEIVRTWGAAVLRPYKYARLIGVGSHSRDRREIPPLREPTHSQERMRRKDVGPLRSE
jgi:hypothetical protein